MKKTLRMKTAILAMMFVFLFANVTALAETDEKTVTILQTSDLHGRIYPHDYATDSEDGDAGLAKIQTIIKTEREKNPSLILMDTGDTVQDNSAELFNDLPVHPMIQGMNSMGYDVWAIGNHEFNFELDFLKRNIAAFEGAVLSANIYNEGTDERFIDGYKIFDRDGVRIAVIGMIPPRVPLWEASAPEHFAGLEFANPIEETTKVLKEIEGQYDVLIGAYHIGPKGEHGYDGIESIAEKFPEFDVIFSGHAHSKYNEVINGVNIIEPGKYGWAVAKADIKVKATETGYDVVDVQTENIETKELDASQDILDEFAFVHEQSQGEANTVVGKITEDFIKGVDYITGEDKVTTIPRAQLEDTAVIDLINDVQMFYSKADVSSAALFNFGSNLKAGDFKKKDVAYIYKYPNTLMGVNITGENLLKYMEWSAGYYNTAKEGDITLSFNPEIRGYNYDMFSGIEYKIDVSKEAGERISEVTIKGEPIDLAKTYKLAVNNYRFGTLMGLELVTAEDKYYDSYEALQDNGRIRSLIIDYTINEKNGVLEPSVDNNWSIIGFDFNHPQKEEVFTKVKEGTLELPTSEDGRTKNVKSITVADLENIDADQTDKADKTDDTEDTTPTQQENEEKGNLPVVMIIIVAVLVIGGISFVIIKKKK